MDILVKEDRLTGLWCWLCLGVGGLVCLFSGIFFEHGHHLLVLFLEHFVLFLEELPLLFDFEDEVELLLYSLPES